MEIRSNKWCIKFIQANNLPYTIGVKIPIIVHLEMLPNWKISSVDLSIMHILDIHNVARTKGGVIPVRANLKLRTN